MALIPVANCQHVTASNLYNFPSAIQFISILFFGVTAKGDRLG
jgi:hypothetical protein